MTNQDMHQQGKQDRIGFVKSQGYGSLSRDISAKDAMKVFLPPIANNLMQLSRPLPKDYQDWVNGWEDQKATEEKE